LAQSAHDRYVTAIIVVSCSRRHASLGNWSIQGSVELTTSRAASRDANTEPPSRRTLINSNKNRFSFPGTVNKDIASWQVEKSLSSIISLDQATYLAQFPNELRRKA